MVNIEDNLEIIGSFVHELSNFEPVNYLESKNDNIEWKSCNVETNAKYNEYFQINGLSVIQENRTVPENKIWEEEDEELYQELLFKIALQIEG